MGCLVKLFHFLCAQLDFEGVEVGRVVPFAPRRVIIVLAGREYGKPLLTDVSEHHLVSYTWSV